MLYKKVYDPINETWCVQICRRHHGSLCSIATKSASKCQWLLFPSKQISICQSQVNCSLNLQQKETSKNESKGLKGRVKFNKNRNLLKCIVMWSCTCWHASAWKSIESAPINQQNNKEGAKLKVMPQDRINCGVTSDLEMLDFGEFSTYFFWRMTKKNFCCVIFWLVVLLKKNSSDITEYGYVGWPTAWRYRNVSSF